MAAIREAPALWGKPFYMMHMSGGTQDVLSCQWQEEGMEIHELLTSKDITAGQFIDRVGVALGLSFPAGNGWKRWQNREMIRIGSPFVRERGVQLSGPETRVQRDIASLAYRKEDIAKGVLIT